MNLVARFSGTVVSVPHPVDATVPAGTPVIVLEAMKMEHELVIDAPATVQRLDVQIGDTVAEGQLLAILAAAAEGSSRAQPAPGESEEPRTFDTSPPARTTTTVGRRAARTLVRTWAAETAQLQRAQAPCSVTS